MSVRPSESCCLEKKNEKTPVGLWKMSSFNFGARPALRRWCKTYAPANYFFSLLHTFRRNVHRKLTTILMGGTVICKAHCSLWRVRRKGRRKGNILTWSRRKLKTLNIKGGASLYHSEYSHSCIAIPPIAYAQTTPRNNRNNKNNIYIV